jgi:GTP cyclohydrolase II
MNSLKVDRMVTSRIPTGEGEYQLYLYTNNQDEKEHLALVMGDMEAQANVLVRVHSECFTGEVLGSRRCDCGEQLRAAMQQIALAGHGVLVYLRQEGRGIGLLDKLRAYNLQDLGYDTVEANLLLGHQADERDYSVAALILKDLDVRSVRLLTNNPSKIHHLTELGLTVEERVPLESTVNPDNASYLITKVLRMDHLLNLDAIPVTVPQRQNGSH